MSVKVILYIFISPLVIWALEGVNLNSIFKKNRIIQANIIYVMFVLGLSYLVVNFLFDFFTYSQFVS